MVIEYKPVEELNYEDWADFVKQHPTGNIFQTPDWFEFYQQSEKYEAIIVAVVDNKGRIQGILLATIQKEHKGFLGKFSSRSIILGGPLILDNNPDVLDLVLKTYGEKIKGRAIYSQFRNIWKWSTELSDVFVKNGYIYDAHLDILIGLKKTADNLLMEMHKGRRKNIRRAERTPLVMMEIKSSSNFDKCFDLIKQTYEKVKLPCPDRSFFLSAQKVLGKNGSLKMFAAKHGTDIIACRFVLCFKKMIYDWYAGADESHLDKYPNDFLPWKVMEWGIAHGYEIFDFGGAGKPDVPYGVRDHKLKFGGSLVEFGRFNKTHQRILMKTGESLLKIYKRIK